MTTTTGVHKQFSEDLYKENDERARAAVMRYVLSMGLYITPNDDLYGPDLVMYGKGYTPLSYIECEIKLVWTAGQDVFPWSTVQLPERKGKYLRKRLSIEYWILRQDCRRAVVIPDYAVSSELLKEVPNQLISSGERFYQIPIEQCNQVVISKE